MITDETLTIDGCDEAVLGFFERCGQPPVVVYDYGKLRDVFTAQGMTEEEAEEWIDFNIVGAWLGAGTPAVMNRATLADINTLLDECDTPTTSSIPAHSVN